MTQLQGRSAATDTMEATGVHRVLPGVLASTEAAEQPRPRRHDAINRKFTTYADYKQWADKARGDWVPGKDAKS